MNAQAKLDWMNDAIWNDDDDTYFEFRRDVDNITAEAAGYPERIANRIGTLYTQMRSI